MTGNSARLLGALCIALLLHAAVLMLRFQDRITAPEPEPFRRVTISLSALQTGQDRADKPPPRHTEAAPEPAATPPTPQPAVNSPPAKSAAPKVQRPPKEIVPITLQPSGKKSITPAVEAKTTPEDVVQPSPAPGSASSEKRTRPTADAVVVKAVPIYRDNPPPKYPPLARRRGLEGRVFIEALVSSSGRVIETSIGKSSGHALLDKAARKAVNSWQFTPGTINSKPTEMRVMVPVHFTLR